MSRLENPLYDHYRKVGDTEERKCVGAAAVRLILGALFIGAITLLALTGRLNTNAVGELLRGVMPHAALSY